jgi:acyl-coenzyme A thioesterase PaaI-like protein
MGALAMPDLDPDAFGPGQPCFGCSPDHPIGFHLRFAREGDEVVTRFVPGEQYQGPPGIMHGGLVTTLADEIAAWAVIGLLERFGFTAALQVKLHRPVRIGVEVEGRGRIVRETSRVVNVGVRLLQGGAEALTGELTFAILDRSGAERLLGGPLPEAWVRYCRDRGAR